MIKSQGFSLVETLISLFLITISSFGLINQQRQMSQLRYQTMYKAHHLVEQDNCIEQRLHYHSSITLL